MACNDASDASTLIAMQSCYHPVVGRSQTKGERRKLAGQERGKHGHVLEKCYIGFCTPTHTQMDSKKKDLFIAKRAGVCIHPPCVMICVMIPSKELGIHLINLVAVAGFLISKSG